MIEQVYFSHAVKPFEIDFLKRWNVSAYNDQNQPALFCGVYNDADVAIINKHKGFKLILNTGRERDCFVNIDPKNVVVCRTTMWGKEWSKFKYVNANFELKDYSDFKPAKLGESVYIYVGNEQQKNLYFYDIAKQVESAIKYPVIYGMKKKSIDYVKENYYKNSFVNLKLNVHGGMVTATEMACMGRRSISNNDAPFCLSYKSVNDIVELIEIEAKKIGTIQKSQIGNHFFTKDWRQLDQWTS